MNQDDWLRKRMRGKKRPGCAGEIGAALAGMGILGWTALLFLR